MPFWRATLKKLAAYLLRECHFTQEQLVDIHAFHSMNSITATLAVLLAGGAYVPLPLEGGSIRRRLIYLDQG